MKVITTVFKLNVLLVTVIGAAVGVAVGEAVGVGVGVNGGMVTNEHP
jgi:hypothetical protein